MCSGNCCAGMKIGIIQDLAIGVHPFGADTWAMGDLLTQGFRGAPPDMFSPPARTGASLLEPNRPWRRPSTRLPRHPGFVMRHAGGLRIDHIIGLFRLWWIPRIPPWRHVACDTTTRHSSTSSVWKRRVQV